MGPAEADGVVPGSLALRTLFPTGTHVIGEVVVRIGLADLVASADGVFHLRQFEPAVLVA